LILSAENINFKNDAEFAKLDKAFPTDKFACEWTGKINIIKEGKYTFSTTSDDGSRLWVNDRMIVDNWGLHGDREMNDVIELKAGWFDFKATHF
jgi:hypothetical protein